MTEDKPFDNAGEVGVKSIIEKITTAIETGALDLDNLDSMTNEGLWNIVEEKQSE